MWQNGGAEAEADASRLLAEFFLDKCGAWMHYSCRPRPEADAHRVLSGTGRGCDFSRRSCIGRCLAHVSELRAELAEASAADMRFCSRCAAETKQDRSCLVPVAKSVRTERITWSARPPNGLEVHLRGQGPRGYGSAARGLPAFEARDAGRVTSRSPR